MKPLPRSLLSVADDQPLPTSRQGLLISAGRASESHRDGAIVMIDATADLHTLREALTGGAVIALRSCRTGAELQRVAALLSVAEAEAGRPEGGTRLLALTDGLLPTPAARESIAGKSARLAGIVWDEQSLLTSIGARRSRTETGGRPPAIEAARAAVLLTAAVAGIAAYDSLSALQGTAFRQSCEHSRDDGFFGRIATDAAQVAVIESVYER